MPVARYQIRSEYGLVDPELLRAADKDDPEALLEGVAMAGLVGLLRQLGDLAEFAAEVFHDLHEDVTATASRGHGLMLRLRQLEAEFPSVEKAIVSPFGHSSLSYNDGIEWHANLQVDQNLITRGDMPRFILDSYEECRGPPRLFTLDKFDVAGAGACLKRYSDPSFFKMECASSSIFEVDVPREKRARKIKKKGTRQKKGETLEALLVSNPESKPMVADHVSDRFPTRAIKLKLRHSLSSDIKIRRSCRDHLLEAISSQQKIMLEDPRRQIPQKSKLNGSVKFDPVSDKTDAQASSKLDNEVGPTQSLTKKEVIAEVELDSQKIKDKQFDEAQSTSADSHILDQDKGVSDSEKISDGRIEGSNLSEAGNDSKVRGDGYRSDGFSSELENFVDALNTMESGIEMNLNHKESEEALLVQSLEPESGRSSSESSGSNNLYKTEISRPFDSDFLSDFTAVQQAQKMNSTLNFPNNSVAYEDINDSTNEDLFENGELMEVSSSSSLLSDETSPPMAPHNPNVGDEDQQRSFDNVESLYSDTHKSRPSIWHDTQSGAADKANLGIAFDDINDITNAELHDNDKLMEVSSSTNLLSDETGLPNAHDDHIVGDEDQKRSFDVVDNLNSDTVKSSPSICHEIQLGVSEESGILFSYDTQSDTNLAPVDSEDSSHKSRTDPEQTDSPSPEPVEEHFQADAAESHHPNDTSQIEDKRRSKEVGYVDASFLSLKSTTQELRETSNEDAELISVGSGSPTNHALSSDIYSLVMQHEDLTGRTESSVLPQSIADNVTSSSIEDSHGIARHMEELHLDDDALLSDVTGSCPKMQDQTILEEVHTQHAEESSIPLNVDVLEDRMSEEQEAEALASWVLSPTEDVTGPSVMPDCGSQEQIDGCQQSTEDLPLPFRVHAGEIQKSGNVDAPSDVPGCHSQIQLGETPRSNEDALLPLDMFVELQQPLNDDTEAYLSGDLSAAVPASVHDGVFVELDGIAAVSQRILEPHIDIVEARITEDMVEMQLLSDSKECRDCLNAETKQVDAMAVTSGMDNSPRDLQLLSYFPDTEEVDSAKPVGADAKLSDEAEKGSCDDEILQVEDVPNGSGFLDGNTVVMSGSDFHSPTSVHSPGETDSQVQIQEDCFVAAGAFCQSNLETNGASDLNKAAMQSLGSLHASLSSKVEEKPESVYEALGSELSNGDSNGFTQYNDVHLPVPANSAQANLQSDVSNQANLEREQDFYSEFFLKEDHGITKEDVSPDAEFLWESESPPDLDPSVNNFVDLLEQAQDLCSETSLYEDNERVKEFASLDADLLWEPASPPNEVFRLQADSELYVTSSCQMDENFGMDLPATSVDLDQKPSQDSGPKSPDLSGDTDNGRVNIPLLNPDICVQQKQEDSVSSELQQSSLTSITSIQSPIAVSGIPEDNFQLSSLLLSDELISVSTSGEQFSVPQPDEIPSSVPLQDPEKPPPLPPLQWRLGRLRHGSLPPTGNGHLLEPMAAKDSFSEPTSADKEQTLGSLSEDGAMQSTNTFALVPTLDVDSFQNDSSNSDAEKAQHIRLSELPPISLFSNKIDHPCHTSGLEDREHLYGSETIVSAALHPSNLVTHYPVFAEETRHTPLSQGQEVRTVEDESSHRGLHLSCSEEHKPAGSWLQASCLEREMWPPHPFLQGSSTEADKHYYVGELQQPLVSGWVAGAQIPPPGYVILLEENPSAQYNVVPPLDAEKLGRKPYSIRNRPRNPLIEAVATHDRSKMRRVSELVRTSIKPTSDERNSLLEQIRNKTFSLKPAVPTKPTTKCRPANLKVAAIIEKANAIRQAFVGSDEEDGDGWNDS